MASYVGPMTENIINRVSDELCKKETKEKILVKIINPLMSEIMCKFYPHIMIMSIVFFTIIVLLVALLYIVITQKICDNCCNKSYGVLDPSS